MCPQTPFIKATFKRPWDTTAILFLVEDSDLMIGLQHSLRESHLRMVLDAVMEGKPPGSATAWWMPTSNLRPLEIPSGPRASHQFLQERMRLPGYDSQDHCMASPSSILRATEVLLAAFNGAPATRHLVILPGLMPVSASSYDGSLWIYIIRRLKQAGIYVHWIAPSRYAGDLAALYWGMIGDGSVFQSFADCCGCFTFYLTDAAGMIDTRWITPNAKVPTFESQWAQDLSPTSTPSSPSTLPRVPGLVSQLQKMNGVEKKRRSRTRREHPQPSHHIAQPTTGAAGSSTSSLYPQTTSMATGVFGSDSSFEPTFVR